MLPIFVPAHIHYKPKVEHHVLVESGSNWDLSSVALVTPVVELNAPVITRTVVAVKPAAKVMPSAAGLPIVEGAVAAAQPVSTEHLRTAVQFIGESAALSHSQKERLLKLPKDAPLFVLAHISGSGSRAQKLCQVRAAVIASMLKAYGYEVTRLPDNCEPGKSAGSVAPVEVMTYKPVA